MPRQAAAGRARWFFLFAWVAAVLLGVALASRVDARAATLEKLDKSGQLQGMSERQIDDETKSAERVFEVVSVAKGVAAAPVQLGMYALAVVVLGWFARGRLRGSAVVPVAGAALLPGAVADALDAVAAFRHAAIPPAGVPLAPRTLAAVAAALGHPLAPPVGKLGDALDFFSLWGAILLGYGVAAAAQVPRRRALVVTLVGWAGFRLLTHVGLSH
ncbi:MAG TPA: hypothetical protein VHB21_04605 [Minicystis sp.]|nr:hypothetical protein [Minicystis sp.]